MRLGLHTGSVMHTNMLTDIRVAKDAGYDAIDIYHPKLLRYLDAGYRVEELRLAMGTLQAAMINSFLHIERQDSESRQSLFSLCARLCAAAQALHCPALQVVALDALRGEPWPEMRAKLGRSLAELADIAALYGVRLAVEPVSFTSFRTISQALEVLDEADRPNVGLCLDTFHLWTGGTPWDEVAKLDPSLIVVAHVSDVTPRQSDKWSDADRDVLPGEGILPLQEGIEAIRSTGYNDLWSVEVLGAYHWEWDPVVLARELKRRAERFLMN